MATISYGTFTITNELDGSQFWTTVVEPVSPDYTFTISDLVGDTNADIKVGDIILFSHYRYTVTAVNADGTTVLGGNRESLRGVDGISPTVKSIVCSHAAVVCEKDGAYNPTTIKFSGQAIFENSISDYQGWFVIELSSDAETWVSSYSSEAKESFVNYTIPLGLNITKDGILYYQGSTVTTNGSVVDSNFTISSEGVISTTQDIGFIIRSIRCSLYSDSSKTDLVDQQRVNIAFDGVDGDKGDDGYTVVLSNENHTFAGNTTSAVDGGYADCDVIGLKGGMPIQCHIGTISGCPTGMTATIVTNDSNNSKFRVTVTSAMTSQNGVLDIPVTVDNKLFNMKFTYSLKLNGLDSTGLGWMVNYSTPTTPNDGECIYFGFDEATKEPSFEKDGWVLWNGHEITIPHGCYINPDQTMPYNTTIYSVYRLPDATTYTGGTFHDVAWIESSNTWKSNTYNGVTATADSVEWVWHEDTDIILAMYVEPSNEGTITNAQLFTPPKKFSELTETAKGMAKEAEKVAYHYLRIDESGAMVANMTDDSGMEYTPSNIPTGKKNILITANELRIRDGQVDLAKYGESIILGNRDENSTSEKLLYLDSGSVSIKSGAYHTVNKDRVFEVSESISSIVIDTSASTMTYTDTDIGNIKSIREVTLNGNALTQKTDYTVDKTNNTITLTNTQTPTDGGVLVIAYVPNVIRQTITFSTDFDDPIERRYNNMPDNTKSIESVSIDNVATTAYTYNSNTKQLILNSDPSTGHKIKVVYIKDLSHFYTLGKRDMEAIGDYSIATGINCRAEGYGSFAGGRNTHVKGDYSFGFGYGTGDDDSTEVDGRYSGAIGTGLQVTGHNSFAVGKYNKPSTGLAFTVGNGSDAYNKSNAFWVGRTGNIGFAKGIYAGTSPSASDRVPLFATGTANGTITVNKSATNHVSISIAKAGYTPWAISGFDISSASCNLYKWYIDGDNLVVYLFNTGASSAASIDVTVTARISYIATSAL